MLVVGDFMLDRTHYCTAIKLEGSAPVLKEYRIEEVPGGAGRIANTFKCRAVGIVGDDSEGDRVRAYTPELITVPFRRTTVKTRIVCDDRVVLRFDSEDTHRLSDAVRMQIMNSIRSSKTVLVSDYGKGVISSGVLAISGDRAIVDPVLGKKYKGVRALVPNREEAGNPMTIADAAMVAQKIRYESGCERVIVKLDKDGAVLDTGYHIPAITRKGSMIGAGDLFLGALGWAIDAGASWEEATRAAVEYRSERIVMANGCFDVLHAGHIKLLIEASHQGDHLVVAIDSDERIRKTKGQNRPRQRAEHRAEVLRSLRCVDEVRVFDDLEELIKEVKPNVLVKGSDWRGKEVTGAGLVERVHYVERLEGLSSTHILGTAALTANVN